MNSEPYHYSLCGWHIRSEVHLPELEAWPKGGDGVGADAEIEFVFGDVPASLDEVLLRTPWVEVSGVDGRARLSIAGVADYLIEDGRRIIIAPHMRRDAPDIRLFLLGAAFGYLCHQRGPLPIHAAALDIDGRGVMLAGISGAGKSTLASAFVQRGHRLLSDDISPIELKADGTATILPAIASIRLWPDSARNAGLDPDTLERVRDTVPKLTWTSDRAGPARAVRAQAIFHLRPPADDGSAVTITPVVGLNVFKALRTQVYRPRGLEILAQPEAAIQRIADTARAIPQHFRLERRVDYANLPRTIEAILQSLS
jgi:hypothetical protein